MVCIYQLCLEMHKIDFPNHTYQKGALKLTLHSKS